MLGSSAMRLFAALHGADRSAACAVARARTTSEPLPYRENVLADLVLASRGDLCDAELAQLAQLDGEVEDDAELRTWLDLVAPGLRTDRPRGDGRPG